MLNLFLIKHRNAALKLGGPYREKLIVEIEEYPTVIVPKDATADGVISDVELVAGASIQFTNSSRDARPIIERDLKRVRGRALQVLTHQFSGCWTTAQGDRFQKAQGFDGNAAVFLFWITQIKSTGRFISVVNSDHLRNVRAGGLYVLYFSRGEQSCTFCLLKGLVAWSDDSVLVAFRAI